MTTHEKLEKILERVGAEMRDGSWTGGKSPYEFTTKADGTIRLTLENPHNGDRVGEVGKDHDEAVEKLAKKMNVALE